MRSTLAPVLAALLLLASGCGDEGGDAAWDGPPDVAANGTVAVEGFNAYLDEIDEVWEGSAASVAAHFLRLDQRTATRTTVEEQAPAEGSGPPTVVVTLDGLLDDSVRAERWTLALAPDGDAFELSSARRDLRCQLDRGHQEFAPEPCA